MIARLRIGVVLGALVASWPAVSQDHGSRNGPDEPPQHNQCSPEHAAMGHCRPNDAPSSGATAVDPDCPPEHAAMGHCTPRPSAAVTSGAGTDLVPGNAPAPQPVPADLADRVWGAGPMTEARAAMRAEHGGGTFHKVTLDIAEVAVADDQANYAFEADAWFGGDIHRLVVKADGEGELGERFEELRLKGLYSRAVGPYFNFQAGLRQDVGASPDRTHLAAGIEGLAPYWLEMDGYIYLSDRGELRADASVEYDQRITQRLILQPKVEIELSAQDIPELGLGAGFANAELAFRLRYEIVREFAPYVGLVHERKIGRTADFARASGDAPSSTAFVIGVRAWF